MSKRLKDHVKHTEEAHMKQWEEKGSGKSTSLKLDCLSLKGNKKIGQ